MAFSKDDEQFMRRALALARCGFGKTSPNPVVGAVLVKHGRVIGEGWHKRAGGPHAEVFAFRMANAARTRGRDVRASTPPLAARRSTLYVTMEPCSTWGKTPPCTDAIVAAGVRRVVVAALDPNPKHNGRGLKILRRAGIRVDAGLLADEATAMNEAFNKWIATGTPFVIAKAAMSLDGKIATRTGDAQWITSEAARREAHKLRARVDAVMVGANTVIRDNPRLTLRHGVRGRQPWRVVVDARGRSPCQARVYTDRFRHRTIVFTTRLSSSQWRRTLALRNVVVIVVPAKKGRVHLGVALRELGRMESTNVLIEGGSELLGSLFDARLVDNVVLFYAPVIIGGRDAVTAVAGEGASQVARAIRLVDCHCQPIGKGEMLVEARVA
ncbi:MAG TPA: bifunctional diaminohydroxyphosphoribosylaminopyrimidine deaminase/5-amino-6-(5-phosphoribosylamino)uracil reductase RibD [Verrucomicrobiae bacterium]|nr:bifunctional diaminohydroxyphosphoribosylaminopyrimidine deaminase/5-amino-6-(5-phosphoribosylamino)uracil reductase RibD [Verrucomicrobiae bacterium]